MNKYFIAVSPSYAREIVIAFGWCGCLMMSTQCQLVAFGGLLGKVHRFYEYGTN